jgi:hypothetical protein
MTLLGKSLVFTILVLSLALCTYAAIVFASPVDLGRTPPKGAPQQGAEAVKSQLAQRQEALRELDRVVDEARKPWTSARRELAQVEARIADNQVWYADRLKRIKAGDDFKIYDLKKDANGRYLLDFPETGAGRPVFDQAQKEIATKTYHNYMDQLGKLLGVMTKTQSDIQKTIGEEKVLTIELNGVTVMDKKVRKGLYDLIDVEVAVRQRAGEELEELKPKFYQQLVDSQLLLDRQQSLRLRIRELQGRKVARK